MIDVLTRKGSVAAPALRKPTTLAEMARMKFLAHEEMLDGWFEEADAGRPLHNYHDKQHALSVAQMAAFIARELGCTAQQVHRAVLAGVFHDTGCNVGHDGHEVESARKAERWMRTFGADEADVTDVVLAIEGHRTRFVVESGIISPTHAILVIADRVIGDCQRVRNGQGQELERYLARGEAGLEEWRGLEREERKHSGRDGHAHRMHVRGAYGIKCGKLHRPRLYVDTTNILLRVELKELNQRGMDVSGKKPRPLYVMEPGELMDLFDLRYQACHVAAGFLGCSFRVLVGNNLYSWNGSWEVSEGRASS